MASPLQAPIAGVQIPDVAPGLGGIGSEAIGLQQANQRSVGDIAVEQDLLTSQIPTAQAARREQLADLVSKAQIRRNTRALFPDNATEFQLNLAQRYQEVTGRMPPINAQTGQVDFGSMNQELARIADEQMELQRLRFTGRGGVTDATKTAAAAVDEVASADEQLGAIETIRGIIQDSKQSGVTGGANVVGPATGSKAGQLWARVKSIAGNDVTFNRQRAVEMFNKEQVLKRTEKMKGVLSDKDIAFLVASVPGLQDTEETWTKFLDRYEKTMQVAKKNAQLKAAGQLVGAPPPEIAPPDVVTPSAAPAAPAAVKPPAEVGVFSDDDLKTGRVAVNPAGMIFLVINGVAKRISAADLDRRAALKGAAPAGPAVAPVLQAPPFGAIAPSTPSGIGGAEIVPLGRESVFRP